MDQLHTMTLTTAELSQIERALEIVAMLEDSFRVPDERLIEICSLRSRFLDELESVQV